MADFRAGRCAISQYAPFAQAIRDSLVASGWSEYDVVYNSGPESWEIVFRSQPLSVVADNRCFMRVTFNGATPSLLLRCYTDWDSSTHVGQNATTGGSTSWDALSTGKYWIRTNGFALAFCFYTSVNGYLKGYGGFLRRGIHESKAGMTRTSQAYAAGSQTLLVDSDLTATLQPGQHVIILNYSHTNSANAARVEPSYVQSVTANSITLDAPLIYSYDAGAIIGQNVYPAVVCGGFSGESWTGIYPCLSVVGDTTGSTISLSVTVAPFGNEGISDPGDVNLEYGLGNLVVWKDNTGLTIPGMRGQAGYLYHWHAFAYGTYVKEDIMNDNYGHHVVLMIPSGFNSITLGPM